MVTFTSERANELLRRDELPYRVEEIDGGGFSLSYRHVGGWWSVCDGTWRTATGAYRAARRGLTESAKG